MFDNKFLKHDPLVEAVKQAQQDGADRRLAEAMTNELFEVYSRQAVVREHLADYDFALEEAYKCMKEAEKMADKDYDKDGKVETSKKEVWGSRLRAAKASGKYKGPVDEDSQIDELSHETLRQYSSRAVTDPSRSAGVELATSKIMGMGHAKVPAQSPESGIPMKEGAVDAGSYEGSKSVTKSAPKEDPSLPKSYPGAASSAPTAQRLSNAKAALKEDGVTAPKEWAMKAKTPNKNAVTKAPVPGVSIAEEEKDVATWPKRTVHKTKPGVHMSSTRVLPKDRAAYEKDVFEKGAKAAKTLRSSRGKMDEDQLDEISKGTAISAYRQKEAEARDTDKLANLIHKKWGRETAKHAYRAGAQDTVGLVRRGEDRGKEDSIARDQRLGRAARKTKDGKVHKQDTATLKGNIKRRLGSHTKPGHLPEETMDEAAYSAKSARAGKDIGKPGKMFSKIAQKAGAKYGSEERGKKVAGAILKRIRAKNMKEENLEELSAFGQAFAAARKAGKSEFSYGGQMKSTAMKGDSSKLNVSGSALKSAAASSTKGASSIPSGAPGLKGPSGDAFAKTAMQSSQRWADPGKRDYSASNQGTVKPEAPAPKPENKPEWHAPMARPPQEIASKVQDVNTGAPKRPQGPPAPMNEEVQIGDYKYRIV